MEGGKGEESADIERQRRGSAVIGLREGGAIAGQGQGCHILPAVTSYTFIYWSLSKILVIIHTYTVQFWEYI